MTSIPFVDADELMDKSREGMLNVTRHVVNIDDVEKKCEVYGDDVKMMTPSRLFARFMSKFSLYNPGKNDADAPSLDAAWAYFENVTLARVYVDGEHTASSSKSGFERSAVGDTSRPTKLYPFWKTSLADLNAFGISVRMYFSTTLVLAIIMLVAGLMNLPLMKYFAAFAANTNKANVDETFRQSAVCDDSEWVECEDCNGEYSSMFPSDRLDGQNVLKNVCDFEDFEKQGRLAWIASVGMVLAFIVAFYWFQRKAEVVFDEEIQTATDYSLKVTNPPSDATDPEEWKEFFQRFSDKGVACITVAIDNNELMNTLIKRRQVLKKLSKMLPIGADPTDESTISEAITHSWCELPFVPSVRKNHEKIQELNSKIQKLCTEHQYRAVAVFVTFHTERGQRNALHALMTGKANVWQNKIDTTKFDGNRMKVQENAKSSHLEDLQEALQGEQTEDISIRLAPTGEDIESRLMFRGKVLAVAEAAEPHDIRWRDLQTSTAERFVTFIFTKLVLIFFISWSGFFVHSLSENQSLTAVYIAVTNVAVPKICEFINKFESHSTEGNRQQSLYINMALFRCFNSAIALLLTMNFIETISIAKDAEGEPKTLVSSVYPVIYAELFTIPIIKLSDIMGNIRKHILAPRARDQEEMNSYMIGGKFELAERYTDATKVLFVALFYASILPESYFLGSAALFIHFLFGKFCLLRIWRSAPDIGPGLARLSRNSFFSTTLVVHMLVSAYFWSGYPYDQVCEDGNGGYKFCNQDMFGSRIFPLPIFQTEDQWMTDSQEKIVSYYGWSSVAAIVVGIVLCFMNYILPGLSGLFCNSFEPSGKDQGIDFGDVKHRQEVQAYVPQIKENGFEYPLIACDISGLDLDLLGWNDPFRGFNPHRLTQDIDHIVANHGKSYGFFSQIKTWDPTAQTQT